MPGFNVAVVAIFALTLTTGSCTTGKSRIQPLGPDLERWTHARAGTSCSSLQGQFRIAAGVQAALKVDRYRQPLLHELSGSGHPPMSYEAAARLSAATARLLETELNRRCPDHRVERREDIVYVPQQF